MDTTRAIEQLDATRAAVWLGMLPEAAGPRSAAAPVDARRDTVRPLPAGARTRRPSWRTRWERWGRRPVPAAGGSGPVPTAAPGLPVAASR